MFQKVLDAVDDMTIVACTIGVVGWIYGLLAEIVGWNDAWTRGVAGVSTILVVFALLSNMFIGWMHDVYVRKMKER